MIIHSFSSSCAAFRLRQTVHSYGSEFDPNIFIYNAVYHNLYVNDGLCSASSAEDVKIVTQLSHQQQKDGFYLIAWLFNNSSVLQALPDSGRSSLLLNPHFGNNAVKQILGIKWSINRGIFEFTVNIPPQLFYPPRDLVDS